MIVPELFTFINIVLCILQVPKVTATTTTTTTTAATTTTTTIGTTTLAPGIFDNCTASGAFMNATIAPNFDYIYSPGFEDGVYPNNIYCRWYITAPDDYAVEAYFDNETFAIERNTYCSYDYVIFYDGNSTSNTMLNKICGSNRPETPYRSTSTEMLIIFSSDYIIQKAGFRIRIKAVDNTHPGCKADYTSYLGTYNIEDTYIYNNYTYINNISTEGFGSSNYEVNLDIFWLFTSSNTTHYRIVLNIISIYIERSHGCIYDRLILYNGPCIKDGVRDYVCGYWAKRWDLDGQEFLLHFHSDFYLTRSGFLLEYYAELKSSPIPETTSTTTFGPPVGAVVDAVKAMLTNYSNENLPARDLSEAIRAYVDFSLVGINGLDEVEQKLTSTGQFEVTWSDPSLSWDPTKRQGVVQVLLPQNDVWKPDIALMNGFEKITAMGAKFMFINIDYNGSCIWKPYQIMESVCKVDMTHYPYDRQICILKFGTWSTDDSEVITELGANGLQIHPNFQANAEWRLVTTETRQEDSGQHKVVEFYLTLERNSRFTTYYMTIPIIMLAYMNVFVFVVPCESGEKTGFSITIFLSFVVLLIINNNAMPDNSDTISLYAAYVLSMTILSALALVISAMQIRAITLEERKYPVWRHLKTMVKFVSKMQSFFACGQTGDGSKRKRKEKEAIELDKRKTERDDDALKHEATDSGSSGYGSSTSDKKRMVSFKIHNEETEENNDAVVNDRFLFPRKREIKHVTLERETTLFEENALIRHPTSLSFENLEVSNRDANKSNTEHATQISDTTPCQNWETFDDDEEFGENKTENNAQSSKELYDSTSETEKQTESKNVSDSSLSESVEVRNIAKETADERGHVPDAIKSSKTFPDESSSVNKTSDEDNRPLSDKDCPVDTVDSNVKMFEDTNHDSLQNLSVEKYADQQVVINEQCKGIPAQSSSEEGAKTQYINVVSQKACIDIESNPFVSDEQTSLDVRASTADSKENLNSKENDIHRVCGVGQQLGSIIDEVTEIQPVSASDVKMNRPISATGNRPLSVNRSLSDFGFASTSHGRALSGATSRPVSTRERNDRTVSVLTQRPLSFVSRKRSASSMSQNENTALLFGTEETDRKTPVTEIDSEAHESDGDSRESIESSSIAESVEEADDDGVTWSDLVSCTDVIFFIFYLFITTLLSLAFFLTMILAY